jgi:hypothetical protein
MKNLGSRTFLVSFQVALLFASTVLWSFDAGAAPVTGTRKVMVLRVYFNDYAEASRYSKTEVEDFFNNDLNTLWKNTSYSNIDINAEVSDLYQLPDDRSDYIDDFPDGDLSNGGKFLKVLEDAIDASPSGLDWSDVDAVNVVMAETSAAQFHRGQATTCNLPMGPGGSTKSVGCAIFSENPSSNDNQVWGRWAHEIGHTLQEGGPAHPSNYGNEFELMDSNLPGQAGVFEKQEHTGFPGWMPDTKYQVFTPSSGGGSAALWAMEYDPAGMPNAQAAKVEITSSFYYLVSVRRRILGDDLNGDFTPFGIPDEGVLIERVSEGSNPWVKVIGRNAVSTCANGTACNRNQLWQEGSTFSSTTDGVFIDITKKADDDNYFIRVAYQDQSFQPDVMLFPWTSPPGNTWETTDIWVDSPVNGYDTYRYGTWDDGTGNLVPVGNGDDPAVDQVNRLYARVRNVGATTATDAVVNWEITDPPGVGIAGASGWALIGTVDKNDFPGLANIAPGDFVDVYVDWTPSFPVSPEDMAAGRFAFHTCLRVKLDPVPGETVFGNQDGDREQENISYFQATTPGSGGPSFNTVIRLRNDDLVDKKTFYLNYEDDLPDGWKVDVNGGKMDLLLGPNEVREVPVEIIPDSVQPVGKVFGVDVKASSLNLLVNDLNPKDVHPEYKPLGGVRVESRVVDPAKLWCQAKRDPQTGVVEVVGSFSNTPNFEEVLKLYYDPDNPWTVLIQGVEIVGPMFHPIQGTAQLVQVARDGSFGTALKPGEKEIERVACMFAGTTELASAGSGYVLPDDKDSDEDRIVDSVDNCLNLPNPDQRDTNVDGFGNLCDPDLNNDLRIDFADLAEMKRVFFTSDPDADLNGDLKVDFADLAIQKQMFFGPPGPSGLVK